MSIEDSGFAVRLTDQMNWDLTREDFEFMMELEPKGCFVLLSDSKRVGIATAVSFGRTAWFGNFIIEEGYRGKGAGSLLIRHSIEYLKSRKVETVGLFSYMNTVPFYESLGFRRDSDFVVLRGKASAFGNRVSVRRARESDMQSIADFDRHCFPGNRKKLLKTLILNPKNMCFVALKDKQMQGYLVAKVYNGTAELGPLASKKGCIQTSIDLIKACLADLKEAEVSLCIAKKQEAIVRMLEEFGFQKDFCVVRMFLGRAPPASKCVYGAESLERG